MKNIAIVMPFVGKKYCFYELAKSLMTVISEASEANITTVVLYDNSNDAEFAAQLLNLKKTVEAENIPCVYHQDTVPPITTPPMYERISAVYNTAFGLVPEDTDLILCWEDDVEMASEYAVNRMVAMLDQNPEVVWLEVASYNRRQQFRSTLMAWDMAPAEDTRVLKAVTPRRTGLRFCTCASQCFALLRWDIVKLVGIHGTFPYTKNEAVIDVGGVDRAFGLYLADYNQKNGTQYAVAITFDLQTNHYNQNMVPMNKYTSRMAGMKAVSTLLPPETAWQTMVAQRDAQVRVAREARREETRSGTGIVVKPPITILPPSL